MQSCSSCRRPCKRSHVLRHTTDHCTTKSSCLTNQRTRNTNTERRGSLGGVADMAQDEPSTHNKRGKFICAIQACVSVFDRASTWILLAEPTLIFEWVLLHSGFTTGSNELVPASVCWVRLRQSTSDVTSASDTGTNMSLPFIRLARSLADNLFLNRPSGHLVSFSMDVAFASHCPFVHRLGLPVRSLQMALAHRHWHVRVLQRHRRKPLPHASASAFGASARSHIRHIKADIPVIAATRSFQAPHTHNDLRHSPRRHPRTVTRHDP